jgi:predicted transcriptional regulator
MARKTRNHQLDLPPLELDCMKVLWRLGTASVQEVRAALAPRRALAYTTVLTVMDRLARKGVATREKRGRGHIYSPAVSEDMVRERALQRLIDSFFGSREALKRYLEAAEASSDGDRAAARLAAAENGIDPSLL